MSSVAPRKSAESEVAMAVCDADPSFQPYCANEYQKNYESKHPLTLIRAFLSNARQLLRLIGSSVFIASARQPYTYRKTPFSCYQPLYPQPSQGAEMQHLGLLWRQDRCETPSPNRKERSRI